MEMNALKAQGILKMGVKECKEGLEGGVECRVTLSPGHDIDTAFMNSQQLWLPAQDQSSWHCGVGGGGDPRAPPLLLAIDGYGGREHHFLHSCGPR